MQRKILIGALSVSAVTTSATAAPGDVDCAMLTKVIAQARLATPYADMIYPRSGMLRSSARMAGATDCSTHERYVVNGERRETPMRYYGCLWRGTSRVEAEAATVRLNASVGRCLMVPGRVEPSYDSSGATVDNVHYVVGSGPDQTIVTVTRYLLLDKDGTFNRYMSDVYAEVGVFSPTYLAIVPSYRANVMRLK